MASGGPIDAFGLGISDFSLTIDWESCVLEPERLCRLPARDNRELRKVGKFKKLE
jgi:hypothetical protein